MSDFACVSLFCSFILSLTSLLRRSNNHTMSANGMHETSFYRRGITGPLVKPGYHKSGEHWRTPLFKTEQKIGIGVIVASLGDL